jgi:integrase/recombinase XerD
MTDECISPLRRRMIEDMTVRNFVPKTQSDYIRRVKHARSREPGRCPRLPAASGIERSRRGNGQRHRIGAAVFL